MVMYTTYTTLQFAFSFSYCTLIFKDKPLNETLCPSPSLCQGGFQIKRQKQIRKKTKTETKTKTKTKTNTNPWTRLPCLSPSLCQGDFQSLAMTRQWQRQRQKRQTQRQWQRQRQRQTLERDSLPLSISVSRRLPNTAISDWIPPRHLVKLLPCLGFSYLYHNYLVFVFAFVFVNIKPGKLSEPCKHLSQARGQPLHLFLAPELTRSGVSRHGLSNHGSMDCQGMDQWSVNVWINIWWIWSKWGLTLVIYIAHQCIKFPSLLKYV